MSDKIKIFSEVYAVMKTLNSISDEGGRKDWRDMTTWDKIIGPP